MTDNKIATEEKKNSKNANGKISDSELFKIVSEMKEGRPDSRFSLKKKSGVLSVMTEDGAKTFTIRSLETLAIAADNGFKAKVSAIKAEIKKKNNPTKHDLQETQLDAKINERNGIGMIPNCKQFFDGSGTIKVIYNKDGTITLKK